MAFGCLAVRSFFNTFKGLVDLVGASLCVCMCVSIVCSFKSMDYLI